MAKSKKKSTAVVQVNAVGHTYESEAMITKVFGIDDQVLDNSGTKQLPMNLFEKESNAGLIIPPLYDPLTWAFTLEQSTRLNKLVRSMAVNTVGLGWKITPKKDDESFRTQNLNKIKEEREELEEVFENINPDLPFTEIMSQVKIDEESTGQGYIETVRDRKGIKVVRVNHVPSYTIRVATFTKDRPRSIRFVQQRHTGGNRNLRVYFKEFNEKWDLHMRTGEWFPPGTLSEEDSANELIQFKLYSPRSSYYGVPRAVSTAPAIAGTRLAHRRNVAFFENDACQKLDAKILTPGGWSTMGDMKVGTKVIGSNGKTTEVTGVYPQDKKKKVYRVHFRDGTSTECTDDHLWTVSNSYDRKRGLTRNMLLSDIISDGFRYESGDAKWSIPMVDPVEFEKADPLPLDPYLVGYLLGNGCLSKSAEVITNLQDTSEFISIVEPMLPEDITYSRRDVKQKPEYIGCSHINFKRKEGVKGRNSMIQLIADVGLLGHTAVNKFIPEAYLKSSVADRISLLQGLIDSDGHVGDTAIRYVTISHELAEGVKELVGSLGGTATIKPQKGRRTLQITICQLPEDIKPTRLSRKSEKVRKFQAPRWRTLASAEFVEYADTQCIRVAAEDSLYVTDDYILTHNTPRLAVIVNGGTLTEEAMQSIEDFIESRAKGPGNAGRLMVLQGKVESKLMGDAGSVKIQLMPLTVGVQDDASFTKYTNSNNEEIREAFGIGQIFIGTSDNVNRAVALAMKQLTVEQIFKPESVRYEYILNQTIVKTYDVKHTKLTFEKAKTVDMVGESQALTMLASAAGVTPNDIRDFMEKPRYNAAWGDTPLNVQRLGLLESKTDATSTISDVYGEKLLEGGAEGEGEETDDGSKSGKDTKGTSTAGNKDAKEADPTEASQKFIAMDRRSTPDDTHGALQDLKDVLEAQGIDTSITYSVENE